jgi:hypothetical protein
VYEYQPDGYEPEGDQPRGHEPKNVPWFGAASMMFGMLAFGTAFLAYVVVTALGKINIFRGDDGSFHALLIAFVATFVATVGSAFGSVACGLIAVLKGERSRWLLLPGLLWLGFVLLCGLLLSGFAVLAVMK